MCFNAGKVDRIVRVVIGIVIISWGVVEQNWLGALGLIPLGTAIIGLCLLYPIFKINSGCHRESESA